MCTDESDLCAQMSPVPAGVFNAWQGGRSSVL